MTSYIPFTFERLVNNQTSHIYGVSVYDVPNWSPIFRVDVYGKPPLRQVYNRITNETTYVQDPDRIIQNYYDWDILSDTLSRIMFNNTESRIYEDCLTYMNSTMRNLYSSIRDKLSMGQLEKIDKYFKLLRSDLNEANDDYSFADMYFYSSTWYSLIIFYLLCNDVDKINDNNVKMMIIRAKKELSQLEDYFASIVEPHPIPEIVQEAIRERGRDSIIQSYMRSFGSRIVVKS